MALLPKPPKPFKPANLKIDDVYEFVGVVYDLMLVVENNIKDVVANQQTLLTQQQQALANQTTAMETAYKFKPGEAHDKCCIRDAIVKFKRRTS